MNKRLITLAPALAALALSIAAQETPARLSPEEGAAQLQHLATLYHSKAEWEARRDSLRRCILHALRLHPMPGSPGTAPMLTEQRAHDGYTVQNFALEVLPGVYTAGSMYAPIAKSKRPSPIILNPNGHHPAGRYSADHQLRCATQARMGAIAVSYDLFAWGESQLQFSSDDHRTPAAHTLQALSATRVLDYLCTLKHADTTRIAITGESGGGSQTMLLAAIDRRVRVSIPVVMLAAHFPGGCPCESGQPVHRCGGGTNNAELAAMHAPRPQLVISCGKDWSSQVPTVEFPYLQTVYGFYENGEGEVKNEHFPDGGHNYDYAKRTAAYIFLANHLQLNLDAVTNQHGTIDESPCTVESRTELLVFGEDGHRLPPHAIKGLPALHALLWSTGE